MGKKWKVQDLTNEVIKDKAYFDKSNGGITISGGEPALQPQFAAAFFKALKIKGVMTALDTCGFCSQKALEMILPYTSMVLFDLKEINPEKHKLFTGSGNDKVLANLKFAADFIKTSTSPATLWIRTPIIPGATDSEDNIRAIGAYIAANISEAIERWELCAFNNLCQDKYDRLGLTWNFEKTQLNRQGDMERLTAIARNSGVDPNIVHWTGSTRLEGSTVPEKND